MIWTWSQAASTFLPWIARRIDASLAALASPRTRLAGHQAAARPGRFTEEWLRLNPRPSLSFDYSSSRKIRLHLWLARPDAAKLSEEGNLLVQYAW